MSPLRAAHAGLPQLLIQAGTDERLAPDAGLLAASAWSARVDVTYTRWPRISPGLLAAADSALAQAAWFLTRALALAATNGISPRRVAQVIEIAGIGAVADQRASTFWLGMSQRMGIAAALLGDPATLIFDEPVEGLDPKGSDGSAPCSGTWLPRAGPSSSPHT